MIYISPGIENNKKKIICTLYVIFFFFHTLFLYVLNQFVLRFTYGRDRYIAICYE